MDRDAKAYFKLTTSKMISGSTFIAGKLAIASFPVFLVSGMRLAIASVILLPLLIWREGGIPRISRKDLLIVFLQALIGIFLFSILLLYGLKFTTASQGGIIASTTPAIAAIFSFILLKERLDAGKSIGIILSVAGIISLNILNPSFGKVQGSNPLFGTILILGAVIAEALFIVLGKIASEDISPLTITTFVSIFGFLMFLPFSLFNIRGFDFIHITPVSWLPILYYGIIGTVVGVILWQEGMVNVSADTAAVFTSFLPISALLFSIFILKEPFSLSYLVGVIFVILGVGAMARDNSSNNLPSYNKEDSSRSS